MGLADGQGRLWVWEGGTLEVHRVLEDDMWVQVGGR